MRQGAAGPGVVADPTTGTTGGARDYELERGVDILSPWYKSPGELGSNDPGRPEDAEEYVGFKTKGVRPDDAAADLAPPPVGGEV